MGQARPAGRRRVRRGAPDLRDGGLRRGHPGRGAALDEPPQQTARDDRAATQRAIEAVWRIESPRLIAGLARMVRDVGLAEDLAQDALVAALEQWPQSGVPDNPGAWLMATAKHRAIDLMRRAQRLERKHEQLGRELERRHEPSTRSSEDDVGDDLLRLIFTCCHPVLSTEARVALTLRLLGGLTTRRDRARVPGAARRRSRSGSCAPSGRWPRRGCRSRCRAGDELAARLASVLEVVYLIFNEGYSATAGDDWMRPALCEDALRLGRMLADAGAARGRRCTGLRRADGDPGVAARRRASARDGEPILLARPGPRALGPAADPPRAGGARARRGAGGARRRTRCRPRSPPATPARAPPQDTDWARIAALYETLAAARAVAGRRAQPRGGGRHGVRARRRAWSSSTRSREPALDGYHLLPSVRGDLLAKLGRTDEARAEFERAAALTRNARERELLLERADRVGRAAG